MGDRGIYYAKYYGGGGGAEEGMAAGEKIKIKDLGEKIKREKEKWRKLLNKWVKT